LTGIRACVGCLSCITNDERLCPNQAFVQPIIQAIEQADVVVFASPTYCFGMTGQMKELCDHFVYRWMSHRPADMRRKIGVAVTTAAGGGAKAAAKEIARQFRWWSVGEIHLLPFLIQAEKWDAISSKRKLGIQRRTERLARRINQTAGHARQNIPGRFLFFVMGLMMRHNDWNPVDAAWWKDGIKGPGIVERQRPTKDMPGETPVRRQDQTVFLIP
jgi:multimeric flavodoxin WrbA